MNSRNSERMWTQVRGHTELSGWPVLFCLPCSIAFASCVFKWICLPSLHLKMMKSCITHVGWNSVCHCVQHTKGWGWRAPQSICLCQITIHKPGKVCVFFLLIYLHCYCLFSFYRRSDSENSARLIVAAASTVITIGAIVSHWKAVFKWWNSDVSRWLSEIKKEAL